MTTRGLRLWKGERGDMCGRQCWFFSPCPPFSPRLIWASGLAWLELFSASGRCDTERAFVVSQEKLYSHRTRERQVPVWTGEHVCHCMCLCRHTTERESCISPWEIKPGHSIHRKTLISPFDKKGIESLFRSLPPTEETAGDSYTWVFQHRFRSVSSRTDIPIALIFCYLQSNIDCFHTTNPCGEYL